MCDNICLFTFESSTAEKSHSEHLKQSRVINLIRYILMLMVQDSLVLFVLGMDMPNVSHALS